MCVYVSRWDRVRPPLVELSAEARRPLLDRLQRLKFSMPGLGAR